MEWNEKAATRSNTAMLHAVGSWAEYWVSEWPLSNGGTVYILTIERVRDHAVRTVPDSFPSQSDAMDYARALESKAGVKGR